MNEKKVNFKDKQGRNIVGNLISPEGEGPFPAVVVCHGFKSFRSQKHIKATAEALAVVGIISLRIDFTKDPGESSLPFEEMTISYELEVLEQAINFLSENPEVNKEKIGIVGHSLGGLVVGWYAATHQNIATVAVLSGVYSFLEMWTKAYGEKTVKEFREKGFAYVFSNTLNRPLKINDSFYEDAQNYEIDKVIEDLTCPLLVIHGTADEAVPLEHAQHFYDRARSAQKNLEIIKGSDHNYTRPEHLKEVVEKVSSWFEKTLNN